MPLPIIFAGLTTAQMAYLDQDFAALGALAAIPCGVAGTNVLSLTPLASTPTIPAYVNYQSFVGVAAATNTGNVSASVTGMGYLEVYKDTSSGPALLTGGEIVAHNLIILTFDSTLNAGSGGLHLQTRFAATSSGAAPATVNSNTGTTLSAAVLTGSGTAQAIILRTGTAGGGFNDTTDTAASIIAAMPGCGVDTYFRFTVLNSTGQTETLLAGSGVTVSGVATTANGATHNFTGVVTSISSPAVTVYG